MSSLPQATGSDTFHSRFFGASLAESDPELARAIGEELARQQDQIELIASENIVSAAVLEAQGSVLTNKYAEGYPGRRYYGGCEFVDVAEQLAIDRAKALFDCAFVNVQPHSGAQANQAVFMALLQPGDTILGMSLDAGGHLTHGAAANQSGKWFNAIQYGVRRDNALIDFDQVEALAREHKPKLIIAGGSAYPRTIDFARFRRIADEVGAYFMVDMAHFAGLVAGGDIPVAAAPCPYRDDHDPQDAARPARRHDPVERRGSRQEDQLGRLPRPSGRPADACHRRQGGGVRRSAAPRVQDLCPGVVDNARALASRLIEGGVDIVSGGTDSHVVLVDLRPKNLTGKATEASLERAAMTCNKNGVPFDPQKPMVTSGVRLGIPAATTRGFGVAEFTQVGELISEVLDGLAASNSGDNIGRGSPGEGARPGIVPPLPDLPNPVRR